MIKLKEIPLGGTVPYDEIQIQGIPTLRNLLGAAHRGTLRSIPGRWGIWFGYPWYSNGHFLIFDRLPRDRDDKIIPWREFWAESPGPIDLLTQVEILENDEDFRDLHEAWPADVHRYGKVKDLASNPPIVKIIARSDETISGTFNLCYLERIRKMYPITSLHLVEFPNYPNQYILHLCNAGRMQAFILPTRV